MVFPQPTNFSLTFFLIESYSCFSFQLPNFINTTLPPHEQVTAQEIDRYFRQELIYKRNERMGKRVMDLLRQNTDKSFFFAFGAGRTSICCLLISTWDGIINLIFWCSLTLLFLSYIFTLPYHLLYSQNVSVPNFSGLVVMPVGLGIKKKRWFFFPLVIWGTKVVRSTPQCLFQCYCYYKTWIEFLYVTSKNSGFYHVPRI